MTQRCARSSMSHSRATCAAQQDITHNLYSRLFIYLQKKKNELL